MLLSPSARFTWVLPLSSLYSGSTRTLGAREPREPVFSVHVQVEAVESYWSRPATPSSGAGRVWRGSDRCLARNQSRAGARPDTAGWREGHGRERGLKTPGFVFFHKSVQKCTAEQGGSEHDPGLLHVTVKWFGLRDKQSLRTNRTGVSTLPELFGCPGKANRFL